MPRLLLTNDDGIDSIGLHVLARAMREHGDVVIVAPDSEYSGAGAALGRPAPHAARGAPGRDRRHRRGVGRERAARAVRDADAPRRLREGRPGRRRHQPRRQRRARRVPLGHGRGHADRPQLRHQRRRRQPGRDRVRRRGSGLGRDDRRSALGGRGARRVVRRRGRACDRAPTNRSWSTSTCPTCPSTSCAGWRHAEVGLLPPRAVVEATMDPIEGREGVFAVEFHWGDAIELPPETDGGAIERDEITVSYLSRLEAQPRTGSAARSTRRSTGSWRRPSFVECGDDDHRPARRVGRPAGPLPRAEGRAERRARPAACTTPPISARTWPARSSSTKGCSASR